MAILMTGTKANAKARRSLGRATIGPPSSISPPLAWVFPAPTSYHVLAHEIGHIFGCQHNREWANPEEHEVNKSNYGYLMKESNIATIMAVRVAKVKRLPFFSSKDFKFGGKPIGDSQHDNRDV